MTIECPHFPALFTFTRTGVKTVEQNSPEDVAACVYRTAVCPIGWREDLPEFGITSLLFQTLPLDLETLKSQIRQWEPRANLESSEEQEALHTAWRRVNLEVST